MPTIDWLHLAAVALGAVGTFFLQSKSPAAGQAVSGLLDNLLKAFEARLSPTTVTPGGKTVPNPLLTIRVLLVPETQDPK